MPRGFLVKRFKKGNGNVAPPPAHQNHYGQIPNRTRLYSDGDRSDTSSDPEAKVQEEPLELTSPRKYPSIEYQLPPEYTHAKVPEVLEEKYNVAVVTEKRTSSKKPKKTVKTPRKTKATRRLNFDEDKSSPVSGTFIRDLDSDEELAPVRSGDIDPSLNVVVVSEEARAELAKIQNLIGDYVCQLCRESYVDAFGLAQHRCSRIVHVEYRCPDCEKVFNCPANLASHRRWHKPKGEATTPKKDKVVKLKEPIDGSSSPQPPGLIRISLLNELVGQEGQFECELCGKKFRRRAYLRKHFAQVHEKVAQVLPPDVPYPDMMNSLAVLGSDCRCAVCGAIFPNRPTLEKHLRLHTNEVYSCKFCTCNFFSSSALTRHINNYHPTESREVVLLPMPPLRPVTS